MIGFLRSVLLVLWSWQLRATSGYTYELRPQVTFSGRGADPELVVGSFAGYGLVSAQTWEGSPALPDATYGCPGSNATLPSSDTREPFLVILPLSAECSDYEQAERAVSDGALGVVFYYTSDSEKDWWTEPEEGYEGLAVPVAVVELWDEVLARLNGNLTPSYTRVIIEGRHYAIPPRQRTFYFIVTAFCILILLSCLWFFTSYFRRCRYSVRNRRRQVRAQNTARKAINKLKVRSYKTSKGSQEVESCAVCLELYCNNDVIRILPCRHEFHKNCVDPWLKIKHTCPLCKGSITSKSRNSSTSSATSEERQPHPQPHTVTHSNSTPVFPSLDSLASSSDSSVAGTSSIQLRLISSPSTEVSIDLDQVPEMDTASPDTETV